MTFKEVDIDDYSDLFTTLESNNDYHPIFQNFKQSNGIILKTIVVPEDVIQTFENLTGLLSKHSNLSSQMFLTLAEILNNYGSYLTNYITHDIILNIDSCITNPSFSQYALLLLTEISKISSSINLFRQTNIYKNFAHYLSDISNFKIIFPEGTLSKNENYFNQIQTEIGRNLFTLATNLIVPDTIQEIQNYGWVLSLHSHFDFDDDYVIPSLQLISKVLLLTSPTSDFSELNPFLDFLVDNLIFTSLSSHPSHSVQAMDLLAQSIFLGFPIFSRIDYSSFIEIFIFHLSPVNCVSVSIQNSALFLLKNLIHGGAEVLEILKSHGLFYSIINLIQSTSSDNAILIFQIFSTWIDFCTDDPNNLDYLLNLSMKIDFHSMAEKYSFNAKLEMLKLVEKIVQFIPPSKICKIITPTIIEDVIDFMDVGNKDIDYEISLFIKLLLEKAQPFPDLFNLIFNKFSLESDNQIINEILSKYSNSSPYVS